MSEQFIQGFKTAEGSKLYDYNALGNKPTEIKLDKVENKSSADIREEITKENIVNALGYNPLGEEGIEEMVKDAVDQAMSENDINIAVTTANQAISRLDDLEPKTEFGSSLELTNSAIAPLRSLKLFGKTTQFSSNGNQLIDLSKVTGASANDFLTEIVENEFRVWSNGNYTGTQPGFIFTEGLYLESGNYTLSIDKELPFSIRFGFSQDIWLNEGQKSVTFEIIERTDLRNISIAFNVADGLYDIRFKVMLNKGTEPMPWENFSNGVVSPSPEFPEELNSAGSKGEINVSLFDQNLAMYDQIDGTPTRIDEDGFIVLENRSGDTRYLNVSVVDPYGDYTITIDAQGAFVYIQKSADDYSVMVEGTKTEIISAEGYLRIRWGTANGSTSKVRIMAVKGTTAKEFAPFSRQVLNIKTPNKLNGISVESEGNYTDENGQQWICDEIDFANGKYIQRIGKIVLNGSETWSGAYPTSTYVYITITDKAHGRTNMLCDTFFVRTVGEDFPYIHGNLENKNILFQLGDKPPVGVSNLDTWKNWLYAHPVELIYQLETPIETELTEEQLAAYLALHTNSPRTLVFNDSIANMEATYFPPNATVPMFYNASDKGKILSVDENGCVVLGGEIDLDLDIESVVYAEEDGEDVPGAVIINADTLGGRPAEEYVTKSQLDAVENKLMALIAQLGL